MALIQLFGGSFSRDALNIVSWVERIWSKTGATSAHKFKSDFINQESNLKFKGLVISDTCSGVKSQKPTRNATDCIISLSCSLMNQLDIACTSCRTHKSTRACRPAPPTSSLCCCQTALYLVLFHSPPRWILSVF